VKLQLPYPQFRPLRRGGRKPSRLAGLMAVLTFFLVVVAAAALLILAFDFFVLRLDPDSDLAWLFRDLECW